MKNNVYFQLCLLLFMLKPGLIQPAKLFQSQWLSLSVGRTNNAFKYNSGNRNGIGVFSECAFSSSIYQQFFVTWQISKVSEFQAPMYDVYTPIEYFKQNAVYFGRFFIFRDLCFLPAIGHAWLKGVNRGKWLGDPGIESYECEPLPYKCNGITWFFQINTNANGWVGIGMKFSGMYHSPKNYRGIALILKIGKQSKY